MLLEEVENVIRGIDILCYECGEPLEITIDEDKDGVFVSVKLCTECVGIAVNDRIEHPEHY